MLANVLVADLPRRGNFMLVSSVCSSEFCRGRRHAPEFGINVSLLYSGCKAARCCETVVPVQQDVPEVSRVPVNAARTRINVHFVAVGRLYIGQTGRIVIEFCGTECCVLRCDF
jgi:hypothetical protein